MRDKQVQFARLVPRLIDKAFSLGFEVTLGDAYRDPRVFGPVGQKRGYGHPSSAHKQRLAIDLNLFKDGAFITDDTGHRDLGDWWEQQHPDARAGYKFRDPNHYSFEVNGVK